MDAGIFNDAHEVYGRPTVGDVEWLWVATFATEEWADRYIEWQKLQQLFAIVPVEFEVRPV